MKKFNQYLLSFIFYLLLPLVYANDNNIYELPSIGTSAEPPYVYQQSPQLGNQIIITDSQISRSGANDIGQLINNIAGVQYTNSGFAADPQILIHSEPAMILVNGQPFTNFSSSAPDINLIPMSEIKEIIITPGVAGTTYGNQSLGGVINIITKSPQTKEQEVSASVGNPWTTQIIGVSAGPINQNLAYRANFQNEIIQGNRYNNNENLTRGGFDLQQNYATGSLLLETDILRQTLNFPGYLSDLQVSQNPRQSFYSQGQGDYQSNTGYINLNWQQNINNLWQANTNISYRGQNATDNFYAYGGPASQNYNTEIMNPEIDGQFYAFNHLIHTSLGIMISNETYDYASTNLFSSINNANQQQYSTYGSLNIPLIKNIILGLSGRLVAIETAGQFYNNLTSQFNPPSNQSQNLALGTLGLTDTLNQQTSVYVRRAMGYQLPYIDESNFTGLPNTGFGLQATTSTAYETGINWNGKTFQADGQLFLTNLDNEIGYYQPPNGPAANYNLSPTRREGVTVDSTFEPTPKWTIGDSLTVMNNIFRSGTYNGNVIPGSSNVLADINARYQLTQIWSLFGEIQYTGPQYAQGDNANISNEIPGYYVENLAINAEFASWLLSLRIDDITNSTYYLATIYGISPTVPHVNNVSYYPAPGRTALLTLTYRFN